MNRGYIKVWRKLEDSGIMANAEVCQLFLYLMLKASSKPRKQLVGTTSVELLPGQVIIGRKRLAADLCSTERKVRTCLATLESMGIIAQQATNKFTVVSLVNWGRYQAERSAGDQQIDPQGGQLSGQHTTSRRPASDQQTTTNKNLRMGEEKNKGTPPTPPLGGGDGLGPVDSLPSEEPDVPEPPRHVPDIELEQFLEAYPERARQPIYAVLPSWLAMKKARAYPGLPRLFDALSEWENSEQWAKEGGRFIPSPQKFLSGRFWLNKPPRSPDPYANLRGKSFHEINTADYEARLAREAEQTEVRA